MSKKVVEEIILYAQKDSTFMQALLQNPLETLARYDLTDSERDFFKQVDEKTLWGLSPACFQLSDKVK